MLRTQGEGAAAGRKLQGADGIDDGFEDDGVNGEEVRSAVENFQVTQGVRAGVSAVALAMGVVGIWGDGY